MKITDGNHSIEFGVIGYEFDNAARPKGEELDYDANWLTIKVSYTEMDYTAGFQDSCLLTWELAEMAEKLQKLAEGEETEWCSDFLEPYLSFETETVPGGFALQIRFVFGNENGEWREIIAEQVLDREQLLNICTELNGYLQHFPQR